jgi:hypothetical protein
VDESGKDMNNRILELINKYEHTGDFTHATVTDEMINTAQQMLNVTLPEQYISFLQLFGHGGIGGIETIGVGITGRLIFADTTMDYREENLPDNLVVIENVDEWLNCLDCNTGKVVSWDLNGDIKEDYDCFDDYLIDQMESAIENM